MSFWILHFIFDNVLKKVNHFSFWFWLNIIVYSAPVFHRSHLLKKTFENFFFNAQIHIHSLCHILLDTQPHKLCILLSTFCDYAYIWWNSVIVESGDEIFSMNSWLVSARYFRVSSFIDFYLYIFSATWTFKFGEHFQVPLFEKCTQEMTNIQNLSTKEFAS